MAETLTLKVKGLYTNASDLVAPEGALAVADNCVIDKPNIIEARRGFSKHSTIGSSSDRIKSLFSYKDILISHYSTKLAYYNSGWNDLTGTFNAPSGVKMRAIQANSNLYITTSSGIYKLDDYNSTPVLSGIPKAIDATTSLGGAGSGFFTNDTQVAYRVVWGFRDANNNLLLGGPSQRIILANSSGTDDDINLVITIPSGITVNHFFQVYRSKLSATASIEPDDELYLVYEANPSSSEITAKSISFTDQTPEALLGASLYTNATQEGLNQSNERAPLAMDIAVFDNTTFYANTISKHRLFFNLLAVGGTALVVDDTIDIDGVTYTGKATENVASNQFAIVTSGSASQNIRDTAESLIRVINQSTSNTTVYAYYLSGVDDLPGKILVEERGLGGSSFNIQCAGRGSAFNPNLTSAETSTNDNYQNGLFWSKQKQPEAVPLLNFQPIGSQESAILRVAALRDSLFIFKEDGVWRLTGSVGNYSIDLFDASTKLLAPESIQVLNNKVYGLFDQGVCSVSEAGVEVISWDIEKTFLELFGANLSYLKSESFGIAYESDRKYILFTVSSSTDTYPTQAFVYNTFTNAWTRWDLSKQSGIVNPVDNKLYLGDSTENKLNTERKNYTFRDYVDESISVTINSSSNKSVTLASVTGVSVGDILYQTSSEYSVILSIDNTTNTVTVRDVVSWSNGAAEVLLKYNIIIEWVPNSGGNPGLLKQFQESIILLNQAYFTTASLGFYSEISSSVDEITIDGIYGGGWGLFQWGGVPWGGDAFKSTPKRTYVPRNKQRCSQLSIQFNLSEGYSKFQIQGIHLTLKPISNWVTR